MACTSARLTAVPGVLACWRAGVLACSDPDEGERVPAPKKVSSQDAVTDAAHDDLVARGALTAARTASAA
jgi:hypothetical protein